jgi:GNAT superfamily N-acetyltransferase
VALRIRPAQEIDYDALARIWAQGWLLTDPSAPKPPDDLFDQLRSRISREMESGDWSLFTAEDGEVIVGMIAIKRADNHLDQIFVADDRRSQGIGKTMLDFVKAEMPHGFWLRTHALNTDGHRFYAREGMTHTRMEPHPRVPENIVLIYEWKP